MFVLCQSAKIKFRRKCTIFVKVHLSDSISVLKINAQANLHMNSLSITICQNFFSYNSIFFFNFNTNAYSFFFKYNEYLQSILCTSSDYIGAETFLKKHN